jgi:hypothetical protein
MRAISLALIASMTVLPASAAAQWHASLREGDRIRMEIARVTDDPEGRFVRTAGDSLWYNLRFLPDTFATDLRVVQRLQVYRGTRHAVGRYALKGLAYGFLAGAAIGLVAGISNPKSAEFFGGVAGTAAFTGGLIGAPATVIGGLLGISAPVWEDVPSPYSRRR